MALQLIFMGYWYRRQATGFGPMLQGKKMSYLRSGLSRRGLDHTFDENALRNYVGYQRDCQKARLKPSALQLILISYSSATVATPPFWLPIWILRLIHLVLARWLAEALLG